MKLVRKVAQPDPNKPLVDERGGQSEQMRVWTRIITNQAVIVGTGNPEGVVEAEQGAKYIDETGALETVFYIKKLADIGGDKTQGWYLVG